MRCFSKKSGSKASVQWLTYTQSARQNCEKAGKRNVISTFYDIAFEVLGLPIILPLLRIYQAGEIITSVQYVVI